MRSWAIGENMFDLSRFRKLFSLIYFFKQINAKYKYNQFGRTIIIAQSKVLTKK